MITRIGLAASRRARSIASVWAAVGTLPEAPGEGAGDWASNCPTGPMGTSVRARATPWRITHPGKDTTTHDDENHPTGKYRQAKAMNPTPHAESAGAA
jgi:hypothetical protein